MHPPAESDPRGYLEDGTHPATPARSCQVPARGVLICTEAGPSGCVGTSCGRVDAW